MVAAGVFSPRSRDETPIAIRGLLAGEPERPEWMKVKADLPLRATATSRS